MKLGIYGQEDRFAGAAKYGFSYMDPAMVKIRNLEDDALKAFRDKALALGLTIDCFVSFFGPEVPLYGGEEGERAALDYATRNFEIARLLGGSICCVGGGKARSIPQGMERAEAEDRLIRLLQKIADRADSFGLQLALEPLRREETDMINTVPEGIRIKRAVDRKNMGCLVDFYHMFCNGEDLSALDGLRPGELIHVHVARPDPGRGAPKTEDLPTLIEWRDKLRAIGYDGRVTLECKWIPDYDSAVAEAATVMRAFTE